jgi:CrcB protein
MILRNVILVAIGGGIGSVMRYLFSIFIKPWYFPFATFTVNILGCFAIGLIMGWITKNHYPGEWRLFLVTGICGGFTTFSSFSWESLSLLENERYGALGLYFSGSIILGFAATFLGYWLIKQI